MDEFLAPIFLAWHMWRREVWEKRVLEMWTQYAHALEANPRMSPQYKAQLRMLMDEPLAPSFVRARYWLNRHIKREHYWAGTPDDREYARAFEEACRTCPPKGRSM